jgi:NADH-quinone oxidoreductase chain I
MGVIKDIWALLLGMTITGKHLGRHAVTVQYPEEKDTIPERSRGIVVLLSDKETGELNCTACQLCEKACPTAAIRIDAPRNPETKKKDLKSFTIDFTLCCFCGLCTEACNFDAIAMATKYEFATLDDSDLLWDVHKLQEMGRDVPYEPTRKKKKPAPKKAADTKPGETKPAPAKPAPDKPAPDKPAGGKPAVTPDSGKGGDGKPAAGDSPPAGDRDAKPKSPDETTATSRPEAPSPADSGTPEDKENTQ